MTERETAILKMDEAFRLLKIEIRLSDLKKIINFYEKGEYPYAIYDNELVSHSKNNEVNRIFLKIDYLTAVNKHKQLKAYYELKYYDEVYRRKIRESERKE